MDLLTLLMTITLEANAFGSPLPFPNAERSSGIVVALSNAKVQLLSAQGKVLADMPLDLDVTAQPVLVDANGDGTPEIVAADVAGSIYAFEASGRRLWKHTRNGKANDFRFLAAAANLICLGDSRGHVLCVDLAGKPRVQANATTYRVSSPAIADLDGDGVPDLAFGTEDKSVYAVSADGRQLWKTPLEGRFGRGYPVAADVNGDGKPEVLIATSFLGKDLGLYALDGATGKVRWHAPSQLQSYHSHVAADLDGDGKVEVLYGDKNTRLYCVTGEGKPRWDVQLEGRGIYFRPALVDLDGSGKLTIFQTVRGQRLFALDAQGKTVGSYAIPGGGNSSPVAARFAGRGEVVILQADSAKGIQVLKPRQTKARLYLEAAARVPAARPGYREMALTGDTKPEFAALSPVTATPLANPWIANSPAGALRLWMAANEYESAAVAVTNAAAHPQDVRVVVSKELKEAVTLMEVPQVLPDSTGQPTEDALLPLNQAHVLHLGAKETRTLWLTVRSHGLAPGTVRGTLQFASLLGYDKPVETPIEVNVSRARLPEKGVYRHCNWLSIPADAQLREAVLKDAIEHGTNVFIVSPARVKLTREGTVESADSKAHDDLVARLKDHAFLLISGSVGVQWPEGWTPPPDVEQKGQEAALRWYAGHVQAVGLDFANFAFYLQDEPGLMGDDANYRQWVELVRRVKRIEPRFQVYANPAGGARAAVLKPVEELVDVWQPDLHLVRDEPQELSALFGRAKHYWHYEAPADQRNLDPLGFYRAKPWVAFQLGMTGGGYWVYHYSNMWQPDAKRGTEYGVVYMTDSGPVTTKRWEASRDGAEDFELLWMLRAREPANKLLKEAVAFVTKDQDQASDIARQLRPFRPDFGKWMEYRKRLLLALEKAER